MSLIKWIITGVSSGGIGAVPAAVILGVFYGKDGFILGAFGGIVGIIGGIVIGIVVGGIITILRIREIIGGLIIGLLSGAFGAWFSGGIVVAGISKDGTPEAVERAMFRSNVGIAIGATIGLTVGLIIAGKLSRKPNGIA